MTDRAFVLSRSTSITVGHTTSSIIDEYSRECLAIRVKRKLNSTDVIDALADLSNVRGVPTDIRSDNGPAFTAEAVRQYYQGRVHFSHNDTDHPNPKSVIPMEEKRLMHEISNCTKRWGLATASIRG